MNKLADFRGLPRQRDGRSVAIKGGLFFGDGDVKKRFQPRVVQE
jgi:hypothetical protein